MRSKTINLLESIQSNLNEYSLPENYETFSDYTVGKNYNASENACKLNAMKAYINDNTEDVYIGTVKVNGNEILHFFNVKDGKVIDHSGTANNKENTMSDYKGVNITGPLKSKGYSPVVDKLQAAVFKNKNGDEIQVVSGGMSPKFLYNGKEISYEDLLSLNEDLTENDNLIDKEDKETIKALSKAKTIKAFARINFLKDTNETNVSNEDVIFQWAKEYNVNIENLKELDEKDKEPKKFPINDIEYSVTVTGNPSNVIKFLSRGKLNNINDYLKFFDLSAEVLNEGINLNEASKDASMKDLANSLGITKVYTSDEHAGSFGYYYGYATIYTNDLGKFVVSFSLNKKLKKDRIPLDGSPWEFLQNDAEYQLTDEQKNFIQKNEKELYSLITYVDYHGPEFLEDNKVEENDNCLKEDLQKNKSDIETDYNTIVNTLHEVRNNLATHEGEAILDALMDDIADVIDKLNIDISSWDIG